MNIRSYIQGVLNEATVDRDFEYYNIAARFYEKMVDELESGNFITQNDGNYLFKGSEVNPQYVNLLIIFAQKNRKQQQPTFANGTDFTVGNSFGFYKNNPVIVINNITDYNIGNPQLGIDKTSFIHEFIHFLDYLRSNNYKQKEHKSINDYYNSPKEFNAYYQEAAGYVIELLKDDKILTGLKGKIKSFQDFKNWTLQIFRKDFINALDEKYNKKFNKRLYGIYNHFFI